MDADERNAYIDSLISNISIERQYIENCNTDIEKEQEFVDKYTTLMTKINNILTSIRVYNDCLEEAQERKRNGYEGNNSEINKLDGMLPNTNKSFLESAYDEAEKKRSEHNERLNYWKGKKAESEIRLLNAQQQLQSLPYLNM